MGDPGLAPLWQDVCVCVRLAGLPGGGLEGWRTRAWPFACARAAGRRVAGQRTRGRRTRTHSCSLQVGLCKTLDGIFQTRGKTPREYSLPNLPRDPEADPEAGGHTLPWWLAPPWPRTPVQPSVAQNGERGDNGSGHAAAHTWATNIRYAAVGPPEGRRVGAAGESATACALVKKSPVWRKKLRRSPPAGVTDCARFPRACSQAIAASHTRSGARVPAHYCSKPLLVLDSCVANRVSPAQPHDLPGVPASSGLLSGR